MLNVESGINDGLALPGVIVLLAVAGGSGTGFFLIFSELVPGILIGVAVPWIMLRLEQTRLLHLSADYKPLYAVAVGIFIYALASLVHANLFLAVFSAGVTMVTVSPRFRDAFHEFGELITELLKLAAILVFGALISPAFLGEIGAGGYVFALLVLFAVRPLAIAISFVGSRLGWREWFAVAWFGPKGFASVVYGLLVLESGVALADEMFHLIAIAVAASIILHSSTDVVVARQFKDANL